MTRTSASELSTIKDNITKATAPFALRIHEAIRNQKAAEDASEHGEQ